MSPGRIYVVCARAGFNENVRLQRATTLLSAHLAGQVVISNNIDAPKLTSTFKCDNIGISIKKLHIFFTIIEFNCKQAILN
jgi:hypothetical protein